MKILSWNINGLRAIHRKGAWDELLKLDADVMCLQEIKAEAEQLPDDVHSPAGYIGHWHSSRERKGYAGSSIYVRDAFGPIKDVVNGLPNTDDFDRHGRVLAVHLKDLVVITGYFPNGKSKTAPLDFKLEFYDHFLDYVNDLSKKKKPVIFCGDLNVAHTEIDLSRPKDNEKTSGFLPVEREWVDRVIESGWTDVYRHFYPEKTNEYTYWDQRTGARDRNIGWRIDYFFANALALKKIKSLKTLTDFMGSDHCPLVLEIE